MRKREEGQALVELTLVLPLIIFLLILIVDSGRVFYTHLQLELATQEAVRLASFGESDEYIRSYLKNNFEVGDSSQLTVTITPTTRQPGDYVTVYASYPEKILSLLGDKAIPYTVQTSSTIRVE